jgi:hypothetical protein
MKSYRLSEAAKKQKNRLKRFATYFVVALAFFPIILAIPSFKNMEFSVLWWYLIFLPILPVCGYFMARHRFKGSADLSVTIDGNRLVLDRAGQRKTTIERENLKVIHVEELGVEVLSIDPQNSIFVPSGLEDFEQFKTDLRHWSPNTEFKTISFKTPLYLVLAGVALLAFLYFTKSPMFGWLIVAILVALALFKFKDTVQTFLHSKSE